MQPDTMPQPFQVAGIVGGVIALLLIAIVVLAVTRRLRLPFTVVLVLVGIGLSALADRLARLEGDFTAKRRAMDRLPDLLASGLCSGVVAMRLQGQYEKQ